MKISIKKSKNGNDYYISQQLSRYYESPPNQEKELKRQQSINAVKGEINILEKHQKYWLIQLNDYELNDYDKNIQQFVKILSLPNNDKKSVIAKYRSKVKQD